MASLSDSTQKQIQNLAVVGTALTIEEGREAFYAAPDQRRFLLSDLDAEGYPKLLVAIPFGSPS